MVRKPQTKIGADSREPSAKPASLNIDRSGAFAHSRRADPEIRAGTFICLGLDVHAAQITAVRQIDRSLPQPAQRFTSDALLAWVAKMRSAGARVVSCYEAGCFG